LILEIVSFKRMARTRDQPGPAVQIVAGTEALLRYQHFALDHGAVRAPDFDEGRSAPRVQLSSPVSAICMQSSVRRRSVLNLCAPMILASLAELVTRLLQPLRTRICAMFCRI